MAALTTQTELEAWLLTQFILTKLNQSKKLTIFNLNHHKKLYFIVSI